MGARCKPKKGQVAEDGTSLHGHAVQAKKGQVAEDGTFLSGCTVVAKKGPVAEDWTFLVGHKDQAACGKVTTNVLPRPSSLSTAIVPPWASTSSLAMAKPSPVLAPLRDTCPR